jgi:8-oxo-dGTP diphosphatase
VRLPGPGAADAEAGRPGAAQPPVEVGEGAVEADPAAVPGGERVDAGGLVGGPAQLHVTDGSVGAVPTSVTIVVGAAIVRDGRVLAARRTSPPAAAGRWELPGGKVEPGEEPGTAVVREVAEELGCVVQVVGWLPGAVPISDRHVLTVAHVELRAGEPAPVEHDRVRWLGPDELDAVDWLEPDRPFLEPLHALLRR